MLRVKLRLNIGLVVNVFQGETHSAAQFYSGFVVVANEIRIFELVEEVRPGNHRHSGRDELHGTAPATVAHSSLDGWMRQKLHLWYPWHRPEVWV